MFRKFLTLCGLAAVLTVGAAEPMTVPVDFAKLPCPADARFADGVWTFVPKKPVRIAMLRFELNLAYRDDLVLRFEYRNPPVEGISEAYVAVNFYNKERETTFDRFKVSREWQTAELPFAKLKFSKKGPPQAGEILTRVGIYSRIANNREPGLHRLEVRNLKIDVASRPVSSSDVRTSYSAYVMLDWPSTPDVEKYRLEIGGQTLETSGHYAVTPEALAPGEYEYRVTALPSGKPVLTDRVIVPERHVAWRLPEYDFAAFAARPHPRFRELAAFLQPDAEAAERSAAALLAFEVPPNPEPYKEGADPEIRAWVEWYGKVAGGVIAATGNKLRNVALGALVSGRQDLTEKAKELALAVATKWDPESGSHMRNGDLQAGALLRGLIFCYDAAYQIMTQEERKTVADCIRVRGDQCFHHRWFSPYRANDAQNHTWDNAEAIAFAALALAEEPGMAKRFDFMAKLYSYRFFPALGFEGENNEGLRYWNYGTTLVVRFVDVAKHTVGLDYFQQPWLRQTARFPMYCTPPGGYFAAFGDNGTPNHAGPGPFGRPLGSKLAAASGDAEALWYNGVPEAGDVTARIPLGIEQSKCYPHIGQAVFNTFLADGRENVAVGFHSGKYFAAHQHADQNSFVINAYGDKLAIDGGYYDHWGSPHFRGYSTLTQAHNTIMVNGRGQSVRTDGADGRITGYFDSPNFGYVAGDASGAKVYNGLLTRFDRQIVFVKPDYVVIFDQLEAPEPSTFTWQLLSHTEQPIQLTESRKFRIERPLAQLEGEMLLPASLDSRVEKAFEISPVKVYSVDPVDKVQPEWRLAVENREKSKHNEFLAVMRIGCTGKLEPVNWRKLESPGAVIAANDEIAVFFNRTPGKTVQLGPFSTDAAAAAVILQDGKATDAMFVKGKALAYGGENWSIPKPGDWAMQSCRRETVEQTNRVLSIDGRNVPGTYRVLELAFGKKIYCFDAVAEFNGAGTLLCRSTDAKGEVNVILGSSLRSLLDPAGFPFSPGKAIICLTSSEPFGKVELSSGNQAKEQ